MVVLSFFL